MGEVYCARDTKLEREVALKVLPAALSGDADYMARFQRDAHLRASPWVCDMKVIIREFSFFVA